MRHMLSSLSDSHPVVTTSNFSQEPHMTLRTLHTPTGYCCMRKQCKHFSPLKGLVLRTYYDDKPWRLLMPDGGDSSWSDDDPLGCPKYIAGKPLLYDGPASSGDDLPDLPDVPEPESESRTRTRSRSRSRTRAGLSFNQGNP